MSPKIITEPFFVEEDHGYTTPCRIWQHAKSKGYGVRWADGKVQRVHRIEWEKVYGPVPDGLQLDHLCRRRDCANVDHLEPVTSRENTRRGLAGRLVTHCPRGHAYDAANTYLNPAGHRKCRQCNNEKSRAWHARKKAGVSR